ncbi:Glycosyltransferase involved in cell wall bisynthesis [Methylomagnum ishizawai]|uniref:Glycosyltransferase involved in cell wall bisynthesis n=1 Tax=Methylomagnum ishizawai TaxID=1760988 RepID=A0A1Y6DCI4_9GAMM|nr:glycosyltransferase [Methylomagnum ishizawai]SMF97774.1 Glycosyltransferase involved in cell wall bisynthesis [Methylomagnum ishizawai]
MNAATNLSICAVLAVRNELPYLRVLLPFLAAQGIEVAILDNGSTDGSQALYAAYAGDPVISVGTLPYRGYFSLSEQLAAKRALLATLHHDWRVHHDADEIMEHRGPGQTLRDAIEEADAQGYNALNFEEFVFLPDAGTDLSGMDYYRTALRYYFLEPRKGKPRLNRAWKRGLEAANLATGGHRLEGGDVALSPANHILRHYIVLGEDHARRKYVNRVFDAQEVRRGWHGKRMNIPADRLALPESGEWLFRLERFDSKDFRRDRPATDNFWHW